MFLDTDNKILNLKTLRFFCRKYLIPNYSKLNKSELINAINKYNAVKIIQQYYRKHLYKNAVDHITLDKIEYPCFIFRTKYGKCYFYAYESIINYIMKTGDTRDPMTRTQYSDELLTSLDLAAKKHLPGIKLKSTLKIKKNPEYARRIRNRLNEILSYQTRLSELKLLLVNFIDSGLIIINLNDIFIDNVEYINTTTYLNTIVYEIKMRLRSLFQLDQYSSETYKTELLEILQEYLSNPETQPEIKTKLTQIIQSF